MVQTAGAPSTGIAWGSPEADPPSSALVCGKRLERAGPLRAIPGRNNTVPVTLALAMPDSSPNALRYTVERRARSDGIRYYRWQVINEEGLTVFSGTTFGSRQRAEQEARFAMIVKIPNRHRRSR